MPSANTLWALALLLLLGACQADPAPTTSNDGQASAVPPQPWGTVERVLGTGSLELCQQACQAVRQGAPTELGAAVVTDAQTRGELRLEDQSRLKLDTESRAVLVDRGALRLEQGRFVIDAGQPLSLETPAGRVQAQPGASLSVHIWGQGAHAQVSLLAGTATLDTDKNSQALGAGESAVMDQGELRVLPGSDLAYQTAWARQMSVEAEVSDDPEAPPRGLGNIHGKDPATRRVLPEAIVVPQVKVHANVRDRVARTEIEEVFQNTTDRTLEGIYTFPLPHDASIVRFAMEIQGQWMEGEVVEKGRAVKIFNSVVADYMRPRDPALLEWKGGNTFQIRIFPIFPKAKQRILLWYTQTLPAEGNARRYVYPLPRTGKVGLDQFTFTADVQADQEIRELRTPMYASGIDLRGPKAQVEFDKASFHPRQDLVMEWTVPQYDKPQVYQGAGRQEGEDPYFMAVLRPQLPVSDNKAAAGLGPRDHVFVVDTSHGTAPGDLKASVAAVASYLAQLGPEDRFNVLAADQEVRRWSPSLQSVSHESVTQALAFLESQQAGGATDLEGMFQAAREDLAGARPDATPVLIYLGDGQATLGELRHEPLLESLEGRPEERRPVIHAIGVGSQINVALLRVLTRRFGGVLEQLNRGEDVPGRVARMALGARRPSLRQGTLTFSSDKVELVYPTHVPTLRYGEELVVVGRYRGRVDGQVTLTGLVGDEPFAQPFAIALDPTQADPKSFVPRLWAQRHIEQLTLYGNQENRQEIIDTSKRHTVMSRYTTFLVLESERMYRRFKVDRDTNRQYWDAQKPQTASNRDAEDAERKEEAASGEAAPAGEPAPAMDAFAASDADKDTAQPMALDLGDGLGGLEQEEEASEQPLEDSLFQGGAIDETTADDADAPMTANNNRKRLDSLGYSEDPAPREDNSVSAGAGKTSGRALPRATREAPKKKAPLGHKGIVGEEKAGIPSRLLGFKEPRRRPRRVTSANIRSLPPQPPEGLHPQQERLSKQLEAEPLRRDLRRRLLRHHAERGEAEQALAVARTWVDQDPDHAEAHWHLALWVSQRGEVERATRIFGNAIELAPQGSSLLRSWAQQLTLRGHKRLALAAWRALAAHTQEIDDSLERVAAEARLDPELARRALARLRAYSSVQFSAAQKARADELADALRQGLEPGHSGAPGDKLRGAGVITLGWEGEADLDLSVVLPYGERISVDSPRSFKADGKRGYVAYQAMRGAEQDRGGQAPLEAVVLPWMPDGRYRVEVLRRGDTQKAVRGWVKIKALGRTRSFQVEVPAGDRDVRIAEVQVSTGYR